MCRALVAAERRKNIATANGRGLSFSNVVSRGAVKDSFAAPRLTPSVLATTPFSRGYILSPLRGYAGHISSTFRPVR